MEEKQKYRHNRYIVDPHRWDLYSRRATYKCYQVYNVNKNEMWMLSALYGYLQSVRSQVVGRYRFFDHVTANARFKRKMYGFFHGLLKKKMIATYEYVQVPGSESLGITELGMKALALWRDEFDKLEDKFKIDIDNIYEPEAVTDEIYRYRKIA